LLISLDFDFIKTKAHWYSPYYIYSNPNLFQNKLDFLIKKYLRLSHFRKKKTYCKQDHIKPRLFIVENAFSK
jgi:hypothetical protein